MGSLTRDMERLAENIRRGHEERQHAVESLRSGEAMRRQSASEAAQRRAAELANLRDGVHRDLRAGRAKLEAEASHLRANLSSFVRDLQDDVAAFRSDVQQDLQGARAAWHGTVGAAEIPVAETEDTAEPPAPAETSGTADDDLTSIGGIGPGIQERLRNAGISSFVQLASKPVEEIREVLGELNRLAHVEEWIAEARNRVGGTTE
ncbi:MAG: hypothetical protein AAF560_08075 [Acidobacteriota bacterium]